MITHVVAHPRRWLWLVGIATLVAAAGLPRLRLETGGRTLRPPGDHVVIDTAADELRFQDPRQVILLVSSHPAGDLVASPAGFRYLKTLLRELRTLSAVHAADILALPGLPRARESTDGIVLGTFLDHVPDAGVAFDRMLAEARATNLVDGLLLARDERHAAFYVPLAADRPVAELIGELDAWRDTHRADPFAVALTGPEVAEATLGHMVLRDLAVFVPVMVVVIAASLWLATRCIGGVVMPLGQALLVMTWTLGLMGWTGTPVTLVTTILPVVLMAMAIADEVHLLERVQALSPPDGTSLRGAIERATVELARPIVATSVTAAFGFLSFVTATMTPLRQFGAFAAFGILFAGLLSFVWVPALMVVVPRHWLAADDRRDGPHRELCFARLAVRHPGRAFAAGLALIALAVPGILRLRVQDSWTDNFAPASPLVRAERAFNDAFWGSYRFDVVLDAAPEFFSSPAGIAALEDFRRLVDDAPYVTGALTYLDPLADVAAALDLGLPLSTRSPVEIADALTVADMSTSRGQLRALVTEGGEAARARLFVRDADYRRTRELHDHLDAALPAFAARHAVRFHYSGDLPVALVVVDAIVVNQLRSIGWAFLANAIVLLVILGRGRDALVCMVPITVADGLLLGGMGYAGMPLGIATTMFASLTAGVGVDFAIHLVERYRRERGSGSTHEAALAASVEKSGRAIGWNAAALAAGFLVLNLSTLKPNHSLGILLAAAMLACYAATFVMLPKLLRFVRPTAFVALLAVASLFASGVAVATESPCRGTTAASDPGSAALMAKLERSVRGDALIMRVHIRTTYRAGHPLHDYVEAHPLEKTLWGVTNGDRDDTRLLYVFSGPGRLAGTSLLLEDFADPTHADGLWLYLRSFDHFRKVEAGGERVMVPGTSLTYQDARGFLASATYFFATAGAPSNDAAERTLLACPRDDALRETVGYDSLRVVVDTRKSLVRRIDYTDLGGKPLKSYVLVRERKQGRRWRPAELRAEHLVDGTLATLTYEHWPLAKPPPADLYRPDVSDEKFLPRLERVLTDAGLGKRIRTEIETANAALAPGAPPR